MCVAARIAALLDGLTPARLDLLPPVERRRFAVLCHRWHVLPANDKEHVHDRMPVIIPPDAYNRSLANIEPDPRDLLVPYPSEPMAMWPISRRVNKPEVSARRASGPRVALPALPEGGPQRLEPPPSRWTRRPPAPGPGASCARWTFFGSVVPRSNASVVLMGTQDRSDKTLRDQPIRTRAARSCRGVSTAAKYACSVRAPQLEPGVRISAPAFTGTAFVS